ncbi:phage tail protein [Pseudomonas sp. Irchel 3A5]|uniref:phage tail protein n=1 Tax=Pseudomonas sp. Irchel 3A5 TaxID=2008911 RepID=UPI000BA36328|nr:phage tail protein [Pseudomonas sp. Irchel 3A5]
MINLNSQFFATLTNVGAAKQANADALGLPWKITHMAIGDANGADPVPSVIQTKLINEVRRAPLNTLKIDPANASVIIAEQVIPADVGGFWIREIGLYDADGDFVAVANCAPSFKPLLVQGSGRTQIVRLNIIVTNAGNVELKIDPAVVLATRAYVDAKVLEELYKLDSKQSVRVATTANIALAGLQTIDSIALAAGDRVLVKNQAVAKDNGLYIAGGGVWVRAADADIDAEVTSAMVVSVEQGATLADSRWQLVTDGVIVLGATGLTFQDVTQGYAPIDSPAFVGTPTAITRPQFDRTTKLATTEFVQRALGNYSSVTIYSAAANLSAAQFGNLVLFNSSLPFTITLPPSLSGINGAVITFRNVGTAVVTVVPAGADKIGAIATAPFGSIAVPAGSSLDVVLQGTSYFASGSATFPYTPMFASVNGDNGWSREAQGMYEQWGYGVSDANGNINVTFPMAWPNACRSLIAMHLGGDIAPVIAVYGTLTKTGVQMRIKNLQGAVSANWGVYYRARGN